jgi:hypothetical protein
VQAEESAAGGAAKIDGARIAVGAVSRSADAEPALTGVVRRARVVVLAEQAVLQREMHQPCDGEQKSVVQEL